VRAACVSVVQALASGDGELVVRVLKRVQPDDVFSAAADGSGATAARLPPTVMVALLHTIAARLGTDTALRLRWVDLLLEHVSVGALPTPAAFGAALRDLHTALTELMRRAEANANETGVDAERVRATLRLVAVLLRTTPGV
jgi:hypothetical protein